MMVPLDNPTAAEEWDQNTTSRALPRALIGPRAPPAPRGASYPTLGRGAEDSNKKFLSLYREEFNISDRGNSFRAKWFLNEMTGPKTVVPEKNK